ncbi:MAG: hypothetical protein M5U28_22280 [Sandaracinaceae bacterium]|nr:hypothetical protein [Sandaracinaceae bacterium]
MMELLDGADLGAWRREVRPAPSVVVTMIRNALEPLAAAHAPPGPDGASTPIVHRDLKPDNVFVLRHPVPVPGSAIPRR